MLLIVIPLAVTGIPNAAYSEADCGHISAMSCRNCTLAQPTDTANSTSVAQPLVCTRVELPERRRGRWIFSFDARMALVPRVIDGGISGGETFAAAAGADSGADSGSGSRIGSGSGSGAGWNHTWPHLAQRTLRPGGINRALSL